MFIRNAWYSVALSAEIKAELFARTVLNEKLVLFRDPQGKLVALDDRCAHRQVPLSKGRLLGDQIECWYHGMRFDCSGKCVHIPSQNSIPPQARVRGYPVAEKYGWVWLWMGDASKADERAIPDHGVCASEQFAGEMSYFHIGTSYLLAIDNLLDLSHIAYVHPKTIVSHQLAETPPTIEVEPNAVRVRRVLKNERTPPLLKQMMKLDTIERVQEVSFWPVGNTRVETIAQAPDRPEAPKLRLYTTSIFTPETDTTLHAWVGMHRDFALDVPQLTGLITKEVQETVLEDKDVTQALQGNWRDDAPIFYVAVDGAANAARKILDRLIAEERAPNGAPAREISAV